MITPAEGEGGVAFVHGTHDRHLVGDVRLRAGCPVTGVAAPGGRRHWLVTGYQEARASLRDRRLSRAALSGNAACGPALRMSVTEMDPPRHTEIRRLIGHAFSARQVEALRPRVEAIAAELLDDLLAADGPVDLMADFASPLTFAAQCELLGVPAVRHAAIRRHATERLSGSGDQLAQDAAQRLHAEITEMLCCPRNPPTGLMATLVAAHRDGRLSHRDLTGLAASLFFDGHALAAAQIGNATLLLLTRPPLAAAVRTDPAAIGGLIEESLRYTPAVTLSMPRLATDDVELGGQQIRAGDTVAVALPLANRDRAAFGAPTRFRPGRTAGRHLSLGYGTHHCIGAHLTRVELETALGTLLRAPALRLAVPESTLPWRVTPTIRTLTTLPVTLR